MSKKLVVFSTALLAMLLWATISKASLELLAGVEAGIDTKTAMTTHDLEKTQQILSKQKTGDPIAWHNPNTGITYKIEINDRFTFNHSPCVAYKLTIQHEGVEQVKPLEACFNKSGHWISLNSGTTAL